ncbi:hypothetical protein A9798_05960 [Edwardsiella hoshinae]|uniref:Inner membrane protein n=1 Tax=Edwardsiella hoshinae TaxID=93378 RepID=A0ABN4SY36_9GAMM|nr:hypothetical protein [Edwardsiella hoshinae]AOV96539.1 hypothetical protein A9798_05960 [Edwardsiella hoshinae]
MCKDERLSTPQSACVSTVKTQSSPFINFLFFLTMLSWFAIGSASWLGVALPLFCFVLSLVTVKRTPGEYRARHITLILLSAVFFCASVTAPGIHHVIWG